MHQMGQFSCGTLMLKRLNQFTTVETHIPTKLTVWKLGPHHLPPYCRGGTIYKN